MHDASWILSFSPNVWPKKDEWQRTASMACLWHGTCSGYGTLWHKMAVRERSMALEYGADVPYDGP